MSSRYTSSYTSRYGSGGDYGSSSYSSSRDRDTSSYRDRDYCSSSRYSSRPKYSSYASKYTTDLGKSTDSKQMLFFCQFLSSTFRFLILRLFWLSMILIWFVVPKWKTTPLLLQSPRTRSKSCLMMTPTTPTEEFVAAPREVLQESQISDFVEEEDDADKANEVEEVKLTLESQVESEQESEVENNDDEDEVRKAQELLASSTQIREDSPVASPVASPVKVSFAAETFGAQDNGNEAENRTPSPTVLNAKKLGGIPWPPKASGDVKKEGGDVEVLPKKRVSDLIARFNTGISDESKKTDDSYKNEYGAGSNVGKVSTHNFA
ncbi:Protein CBG16049 [Caenorhabditis briggsae]|uniref:Protein CBG16049 n=1 Tax=Caenorhabditis briggsae TaxID=6238 RepID=A8XN75_CAEBR|nr:Protein CBG16049 [Caenorhabditis briggsae]CAP34305.2 Protein CBG16049 [Caenorhabditis briggsae]